MPNVYNKSPTTAYRTRGPAPSGYSSGGFSSGTSTMGVQSIDQMTATASKHTTIRARSLAPGITGGPGYTTKPAANPMTSGGGGAGGGGWGTDDEMATEGMVDNDDDKSIWQRIKEIPEDISDATGLPEWLAAAGAGAAALWAGKKLYRKARRYI